MDGRWGTVCNSNQEEIAGAVCSQLGLPIIGSLAFVTLLPYVCMHAQQSAHLCGLLVYIHFVCQLS